jgi:hypothetical protein
MFRPCGLLKTCTSSHVNRSDVITSLMLPDKAGESFFVLEMLSYHRKVVLLFGFFFRSSKKK